jgi:hypothetical protein
MNSKEIKELDKDEVKSGKKLWKLSIIMFLIVLLLLACKLNQFGIKELFLPQYCHLINFFYVNE